MILSRLLQAIFGGKHSTPERRYWLFYAGLENYLSEGGIRELPREVFWSCEPETRKGDLILVYRKSKKQLTVPLLMQKFGMSQETAGRVNNEDVGKDFPVIWEATSNSRRKFFWSWPYGCDVREFRKILPPLQLEQLKVIPELKKWEGLRFNLQAKGRSALEIPPFAWKIISNVIERNEEKRNSGQSSEHLNPNKPLEPTP